MAKVTFNGISATVFNATTNPDLVVFDSGTVDISIDFNPSATTQPGTIAFGTFFPGVNWGGVDVSVSNGTETEIYLNWSVEASEVLPNTIIFIDRISPDYDFSFSDPDFVYEDSVGKDLLEVMSLFTVGGNTNFLGSSAGTLTNSVQYAPRNDFNGIPTVDAAVPLPAAGLLLAASLIGLSSLRRRAVSA